MTFRSRLGLMIAVILAAIGFTFTQTVQADPAPRTGGILGAVMARGSNGPVGVPGAAVQLLTENGRVVAQTRSGEGGRFTFRDIRPGRYVVVAAKPDVGRGRSPVAVTAGQIARVRVGLAGG